jgi:MEDS: MEthanogen/methylotroph, DcmR Sensory domain
MIEKDAVSASAAGLWDGHQLLVAEQNDDDAGLARWAAWGLARGDKLLFAADKRHPDQTSLAATLTRCGVDAARAVDDGRLEVLAAAQFYDLEGYEQLVEHSLRDGHGGVRSYGGPQLAAAVLDPAGFAEFERQLDRLWTTRGATALCCYPVVRNETLNEAIRRHPSGWHHRLLHVHPRGHGRVDVHGEIDSSNDELFAAVLAAAADRVATGTDTEHARHEPQAHQRRADDPGCDEPGRDDSESEVRGRGPVLALDCAGLGFSSVSGWRAAVAGTEVFRAEGGRVVLTGLHPLAVRVLHMTGFAAAFDLPAAGTDNR